MVSEGCEHDGEVSLRAMRLGERLFCIAFATAMLTGGVCALLNAAACRLGAHLFSRL